MGAAALKFRGCEYMPIKLKGLLVEHGITQHEVAAAVRFPNGRAVSRTTVSLLINWGYYPKGVEESYIRDQLVAFLRARQFDEADIATAFDQEGGEDAYRGIPARGAYLPPPQVKACATGPNGHKIKPRPEPDFTPMEVEMLSPAAKRHFKLFRDPFTDDVNGPEDVFMSEEQRYIREAMLQTAKNGGFTAIAGESGSGKSTLRKLLQHAIARDGHNIRIVFPRSLDKAKLSTGAICTAIVKDLQPDATVRSSLEAQARQVEQVLRASARAGFKHVLMIEEAHDLSIQTLKYLKRFYEIESDDGFGKVLSIILVGQPELKLKLDEQRYPEAREVIRRCELAELAPLTGNLRDYLEHKFARVSVPLSQVFDDDAFEAIRARWTKMDPATRTVKNGLYPLIVNNTVTRAMNRAAQLGVPLVTADLVKVL